MGYTEGPGYDVWHEPVNEGSTPLFSTTILNSAGVATQPATLTKAIHLKSSGAELIAPVSILSDSAAGVVSHQMAAADTGLTDATVECETRLAVFRWTESGGAVGSHILEYTVRNVPPYA